MTTPLGRLTEDELRVHGPWLVRVARGLVASESEAEDLAQDVWLELARGTGPIGHLRALAASVARRLAGHRRAAERAREERERRHARDEALPGPDELVEVLDVQRLLLEELRALDEVHRTPLVLHYHEGLSAAEIARRRGVPASTVRSQLERAHAELRARLDRRHGGERRLWVALVARLPRRVALTGGTVAGGLLMTTLGKTLLAAGVLGVLAMGWRLSVRHDGPRVSPADAVATADTPLAEPGALLSADTPAAGDPLAPPEARAETRSAPAVEAPAAKLPLDVAVLVLDEESAQPLPEFELDLWHEEESSELTTDAEGRATIEARWFEAPFELLLRGDSKGRFEDEGHELGPADRPAAGEPLVLRCATGPSYTLLFDLAPPEGELFASLSAGTAPPSDPRLRASLHRDGARTWTRFPPTRAHRSSLRDGPWLLTVFADDGLWRACGPVATIVGEQREPVRLTSELCGAVRVSFDTEVAPVAQEFVITLFRPQEGKWVQAREVWLDPKSRSTRFEYLEPGEYQVSAWSILHESVRADVRVDAGAVAEASLTLAPKPDLRALRVVLTSETGTLDLGSIMARARELATNTTRMGSWLGSESTSKRRVLLIEGLARTAQEVTLDGAYVLPLAWSPGTAQLAGPEDDEVVFTCLDANALPQVTGKVRVLTSSGGALRDAAVVTFRDGSGSFHHVTDARGETTLESLVAGARFELFVNADGFRPRYLRELALPFETDALEVRLEPGWGAWLDVRYLLDPLPTDGAETHARAAGAQVLVDGVPAGELDERGQILLSGDAPPAKIEVLYPGYHLAYGHIDAATGAPPAHYSGSLWVVLEPDPH
ncbi:MAG: sigma-70 family RNA polymerase sigma factor [Planctomycetes bacterium]|nr:sigma-70 family RNA polymerase sigma factor [Planctomycetota bacterium]